MENSENVKKVDDKIEILSIIGEDEKKITVDRYKVMILVSTLAIIVIVGVIFWLAGNGGGTETNKTSIAPSGTLQFTDQKDTDAGINKLPYPTVKNSVPLKSGQVPAKPAVATKTPTPDPTAKPADPTATPTQTPQNTPVPTSEPTQAPTTAPSPTESLSPTP